MASKNGRLEIVKYLVSFGADIHTDHYYAVQNASVNGNLEIVKYLVSLRESVPDNCYPEGWSFGSGQISNFNGSKYPRG